MAIYSCTDMPTIQAFMDSDAFIRGLMGPYGCLTPDTEFLSPTGWQRIDQYRDGQSVLQWHPGEGTSWTVPERYVIEKADVMLLFETKGLKMALSPEHSVPHLDYLGRFRVSTAADIAASTTRKTIPTTFLVPGAGLSITDARIRYDVMMQADGHFVPHGQQAHVIVRKPRKKRRVKQVLTDMGIAFEERSYDGRPTESVFVFYPPDRQKHFPSSWYGMSVRQLEVVLDEAQHWDGQPDHAERLFFSNHKDDADFIQFAAHGTGRRATMSRYDYENDGWTPSYRVFIRTGDNAKNRVQIREHTEISAIQSPDGHKYCFTVPTGFFVARYRQTVFITGNSGKTSACIIELAQRGMQQAPGPDGVRRSRFGVIRNTAKQLEDTTERSFLQWFPPYTYGDWTPSKHNYVIRALKGEGDDRNAEIEVMFRALDRPDQIGDLLSLEFTGAWIHEGREVPWPIIDAVTGRVGRYPAKRDGGATWSGIWSDTNPPDVDSEWFKFFEEMDHTESIEALAKVVPGVTVENFAQIFKQPSGLAPNAENLANLPTGYYERLAIGKAPEWIKVYIDGKYGFVADGKAVWPEYSDPLHCPADKDKWPRPIKGLSIYRGWDFGLTPACIFSQITPRGQWIVFDELIATGMGADAFGDQVNEHSSRHYPLFDFIDVGDPAGNERSQANEAVSCFRVLHGKGIMIEPGIQTLNVRLESVRKPLRTLVDGRPQFVLHPRCKRLRRGLMGGYHFRRMRISGERYTTQPEKDQYSHPCDALGYSATRLFGTSLYGATNDDRYEESRVVGTGRSRSTGY